MKYLLEQPWLPFSEVQWEWDVGFHDLMLGDQLRMEKYKAAIKEVIREGDVVLDLGAGTGILSLWALQAGASKVYGIEIDPAILSLAVDQMNAEGYGEKFIPVNKVSFEAVLPEQVDVVLSEIIGNLGDNEGFQTILEDAYRRFAKADHRAIPRQVTTYLAPVCAKTAYENVAAKRIATINDNYDIDRLMAEKNLSSVFNLYYDTIISEDACLSPAKPVKTYSDRWQQSSSYSKHTSFKVEKDGVFTGFKGYFIAQLSEGVVLDISGDNIEKSATSDSWKHAYLPIEIPVNVEVNDTITLLFTRSNPRFDTRIEQIYHWQGSVIRNDRIIANFEQCLDENELGQGPI